MLLGLALLFVGAVLFLNGLWLMGHVDDREIAVINIFVGGLTLLVALFLAFGPGADLASVKAAALTLCFTFTYLWVAYTRQHSLDAGNHSGYLGDLFFLCQQQEEHEPENRPRCPAQTEPKIP